MTLKQKYNYVIIAVMVILCGIMFYINNNKNTPAVDTTFYNNRIDSLNTENMRLQNDVLYREQLDSIRLKKLDSLSVENKRLFESREKLKKIITIYDTFKSVDINASADSMRSVLTEAGFR